MVLGSSYDEITPESTSRQHSRAKPPPAAHEQSHRNKREDDCMIGAPPEYMTSFAKWQSSSCPDGYHEYPVESPARMATGSWRRRGREKGQRRTSERDQEGIRIVARKRLQAPAASRESAIQCPPLPPRPSRDATNSKSRRAVESPPASSASSSSR